MFVPAWLATSLTPCDWEQEPLGVSNGTAMTTKTIIEATITISQAPDAKFYFSSFELYLDAMPDIPNLLVAVAHQIEVEVGSFKWALAESHDYTLRGYKAPFDIERIISVHTKAVIR